MPKRVSLIFVSLAVLALSGCASLGPSGGINRTGPWNFDVPIGGLIRAPLGMNSQQAASEITSRSVLLLGTPYKLGGTRPSEGLDCSGLIAHVFQDAFSLRFPRTVEEQAIVGQEIPKSALLPGDLVFFNTQGRKNSHVGIYLGESRFIHAPTQRGVVRIESLQQSYWSSRFDQARRLLASN